MRDVEVDEAARLLAQGQLVAFPTETVYGLGADALAPAAVAQIFAAKGRPSGHPLIVHLAEVSDLSRWVREFPPAARRMADVLWPGPLTLILRRAASVPDAVTGGLDTVGIRVPSHPIAQALLRAFGSGIAAPSANLFGGVSPTTAEHVRRDLAGRVDALVDGGPCSVGLESTIVDVSTGLPTLLRPGGVPREEIEALLGAPLADPGADAPRAPGMLASHYAPRARVVAVSAQDAARTASELVARGERVAIMAELDAAPAGAALRAMPTGELEQARTLYASLRAIADEGFDVVVVALPPERGLGRAIADRIRRAAAPRS